MNLKNPIKIILLFSITGMSLISEIAAQRVKFISVPEQELKLNSFVGRKSDKAEKISAFRISEQITFGQYKKYLFDIKKDSSEQFYESQLPKIERQNDFNEKYRLSSEFDKDPVIGISQENATNYVVWYSKNYGNKSKNYRLPAIHEWISFYHVQKEKINNSLFFDWTINAFDNSLFEYGSSDDFPFYFFHNYKKDDPSFKKLKCVIGNSYKFRSKNPSTISKNFGYYANEGYSDVGFRIIETEEIDPFYKYASPIKDDIKLK
jgi:hypothetical protein